MADIAYVFGWPPHHLNPMALDELMHWRALAIERHNAAQGARPSP